jgi:ribosome biogenesis GTPase / thiamine phosphate phosphatase
VTAKGPVDWDALEEENASATFEKSAWKSSRRRRQQVIPAAGGEATQEAPALLVVSVGAKRCTVLLEKKDGTDEDRECRLPSSLAARQRSGLAVGDRVTLERRRNAWWVTGVEERRTSLSRPDPRDPRRRRVVAANVDLVVIVCAARKPGVRTGLIDRYLLAVQQGGAEAVVCINKIDLADGPEDAELEGLEVYRQLGLPVVLCSAAGGQGLDALRRALAGKTCVFVGHSGVGKSSLLNSLLPDLDLATRTVHGSAGTGRHTTTRSTLYRLEDGTRIIDTPGIREFGLWDLQPEEVAAAFPELTDPSTRCRFANCRHTHEPDCGVKEAVEAGTVPAARYQAYLRILASLDEA